MRNFLATLLIPLMVLFCLTPSITVMASSQNTQSPPPNTTGTVTYDITVQMEEPPGGWPNGENIPPPNNNTNNNSNNPSQQLPPPPPPPPATNSYCPYTNPYYWTNNTADYYIVEDYYDDWDDDWDVGVSSRLRNRVTNQLQTMLDYGADHGWNTDFNTIEKKRNRYVIAIYYTDRGRSITVRQIAKNGRIYYERNGNRISKKKIKRLLRRY